MWKKFRARPMGVQIAVWVVLAVVIIAIIAAANSSESEARAEALPAYCEKVTGEALTDLADDVRGTVDRENVYAVKSEKAPQWGAFAREGLYFVALPYSGIDTDGMDAEGTAVAAVSGGYLKTGGGIVFPADRVTQLDFKTKGVDLNPNDVLQYSKTPQAGAAVECAEIGQRLSTSQ